MFDENININKTTKYIIVYYILLFAKRWCAFFGIQNITYTNIQCNILDVQT